MCKILDQFNDKIKGTFSFFDRMSINGYHSPLMNEHSRVGVLYQLGVLYKDYQSYFTVVTNSIKKRIEDSAAELERRFLEDIYPSPVGHAFYDLTCTDVFTFMGRKPDPRFQGEAVSDYKDRPVGYNTQFSIQILQASIISRSIFLLIVRASTTSLLSIFFSASSALISFSVK